MKGKPLKDGSGKGMRLNRGRGGCEITEDEGKGMKISRLPEDKLKWDDEFCSGDWK